MVNFIYFNSHTCLFVCNYLQSQDMKFIVLCTDLQYHAILKMNDINFIPIDNSIAPLLSDFFSFKKLHKFQNYKKKRNLEFNKISSLLRPNCEYKLWSLCFGLDFFFMNLVWFLSNCNFNIKFVECTLDDEVFSRHLVRNIDFLHKFKFFLYKILYYNLPFNFYSVPSGRFYFFDTSKLLNRYTVVSIRRSASINNIKLKSVEHPNFLIIGGYDLAQTSLMYNIDDLLTVYKFISELELGFHYKPHPGTKIIDPVLNMFPIFRDETPLESMHPILAVGDLSSAFIGLCQNNVPSISFIELIRAEANFDKEFWRKRLVEQTNNTLVFVSSLNELEDAIFLNINDFN